LLRSTAGRAGRGHGSATRRARAGWSRRAAAPLLALWRDGALHTIAYEGPDAGGYGGDIAALGERYFVSATRAGKLLSWSARTGWAPPSSLDEAGALAVVDGRLWCGAAPGWVAHSNTAKVAGLRRSQVSGLRPDNHVAGSP
jgi:hypothetical protein